MKLFVMDAGELRCPNKGMFTPGRDDGVPITIPVPMYLIDHPEGLVAVDAGMNVNYWPAHLRGDHDDDPEQYLDRRIEQLGYALKDVKYVIMSHYHLDHTGGMTLLPNATFIVRKSELQMAWWPPGRENGAYSYVYEDYKDTRLYTFIEIEDDVDYDVFGDGSVICIDTRGHTRGHQSVIVNLPDTGRVVLALDAASLRENIDDDLYPGTHSWDKALGLQSIGKLRKLRDEGALVLLGHDPEQWQTLKRTPAFYG